MSGHITQINDKSPPVDEWGGGGCRQDYYQTSQITPRSAIKTSARAKRLKCPINSNKKIESTGEVTQYLVLLRVQQSVCRLGIFVYTGVLPVRIM